MTASIYNCLSRAKCFMRINSANKICMVPLTTSSILNRKHVNPKYAKERAAKVLKVNLPDFDEERENQKLSIDEIRAKLKEKGIAPARPWNEKPMFIDSAGEILDAYIPPEGDGKISPLSSANAVTDMYDRMGKKSKSYMAVRKIRKIDYEFDVPTVAEKAKDIYIEAQKALAEKNEEKLHEFATVKAIPEMLENVKNKTIVWNFIQCLEPPRIVHVRAQEMLSKNDMFAQVTVRLHTQQTLAVYDRFGRLMHGSETAVKDVLEYIVFEKHITHPNGTWKIHGKIIPDWLPPRDPILKTFSRPDLDKEFPLPPPDESPKEIAKESSDEQPPAIASA